MNIHQTTLMLLLLAPLLAACADDAIDDCAHAVCSILDPACVERISRVVACRRDESVLTPAVRFLSADEVLAEWEAEAEPPTAEELQDQQDYLRGLALVGLMPENYEQSELNVDAVRNIAAFYDPESLEIVVITDHASPEPAAAYGTMVHELVHAYQDARWDLTAYQESHATTRDRALGVRALIEGEAVLFADLAHIELSGYRPNDIRWFDYFREWQRSVLEKAAESETPHIDVGTLFPYAYGGHFVYDAWDHGESDGVAAVYADPPDSVREVMAGHAAWPSAVSNEDGALDPHAAPVMPAPYEYLLGAHQGVWLLNAMLQRTADAGLWSGELDFVSADYLTVLRHATSGEVSVVWRIQSASSAALASSLRAGDVWDHAGSSATASHMTADLDGDLLLVASSGADAALVWADIAGWTHPDEAFPPDPDAALIDDRRSRFHHHLLRSSREPGRSRSRWERATSVPPRSCSKDLMAESCTLTPWRLDPDDWF